MSGEFWAESVLTNSSYLNPAFPNALAVIGGPKVGLYDIRNLSATTFSSISNLKSLTSVNLTSSRLITSGLDGSIKIYKYTSNESSNPDSNHPTSTKSTSEPSVLELAYQMKRDEGVAKFAVDPFCMNHCTILIDGRMQLCQKKYYQNRQVREKVLEQQGLANIDQILESAQHSDPKNPVFASIGGIKYSEKMLARRLGRGLRHSDRGSYKYYNRGLYSRYEEEDPENPTKFIEQDKAVNLSEYDKFLRKFLFKEALVKVLKSGNSQKILGVLEQLMIQDDLDTGLAQFGDESSQILLLRFLVKKMNSENCRGVVMYLTERFLEILQGQGSVSEDVFKWVTRLRQKVEQELLKEKEIDEINLLLGQIN